MDNIFVVVPDGIESENGKRDYWRTVGALISLCDDHGRLLGMMQPASSWEKALAKASESRGFSLIIRHGYYIFSRYYKFESIRVALGLFSRTTSRAIELTECTIDNPNPEDSLRQVEFLSDKPLALVVNQISAGAMLAGDDCEFCQTKYKMLERL